MNVDSEPIVYSRSCLSKLKKMTTETEESHYGCLLEAKCKWNKMTDLLELLQEWISAGFRGGKKESIAKVNNCINYMGGKKYSQVNNCHLWQLQLVWIWVFLSEIKECFCQFDYVICFFIDTVNVLYLACTNICQKLNFHHGGVFLDALDLVEAAFCQ